MTHMCILELKLVGDIAGQFRVARYQRGYRWSSLEVNQLLNDIWNSNGAPYSLQPVVVKREPEREAAWELVDGQQRLTTLYLIFAFMNREHLQNADLPYSITYDTRPGIQNYLANLDPEGGQENIDCFHIYEAYECIRAWFNGHHNRRQHVANQFYGYLFDSVRVIWYEAPQELDATTLFRRLNVGRIPLTDAELFKALLLSRRHNAGGVVDRTHEIAAQWDTIERSLQHPDIWAFIADEATVNTPTRITLLLDTLAGGPHGAARPQFHTFDVLRARVEANGSTAVWNEVVALYELILGWYESRDHYHKIGYLVAIGQRFGDLVSLAGNQNKHEFDAILDKRIRETLNLTPTAVASLSYESDKKKCTRLLLLMNVETVRRIQGSSERYSFRLHRKQAWSLEHIHAQHADTLTNEEQWREWLQLHREALADLTSIDPNLRKELLQRIDNIGNPIGRQVFQELVRDVSAAFTFADTSPPAAGHTVHSISNLALLANGHNSALSNSAFEVKRRRILALDRQGAYIPICTRQVFLKYYTDADAQQFHFWSTKDRNAYLSAILSPESGVGSYLK